MNLFFDFHDLVGVMVETDSPAAQDFFAAEYAHHRVEALPPERARVVVRFREGGRPAADMTPHTHKALARWAYRLGFAPREITIEVVGNRTAIPMVHHMLVHPSLRYLAAAQGVLMLHAGAVAHEGHSLILTGRGGAGKTTTTSVLLDAGGETWGVHADDYVFLAEGPVSRAYLTRSHLYLPLLRWVPDMAATLTAGERLRLEFFGRLRAWSGERIKWPVRIDPRRLWPRHPFVMQARPAALVLLQREAVPRPVIRPLSDEDFPFEDLIAMNFSEARHFIHLIRKHAAVPDVDAWVAAWRARESALLRARKWEIPAFVLTLPQAVGDVALARQHVVAGINQILHASVA